MKRWKVVFGWCSGLFEGLVFNELETKRYWIAPNINNNDTVVINKKMYNVLGITYNVDKKSIRVQLHFLGDVSDEYKY